jgi:hypothetical protein
VQLHSVESFLKRGLSELSTWVGIAMFIFGAFYYKEINELIKHILASPLLVEKIINGIAAAVAFGFILYKQKK